jgi:hypothetical protein
MARPYTRRAAAGNPERGDVTMWNKVLAAYSGFVATTMTSIVVSGEVLSFWARILLGVFNGTGAAAGILANLAKKGSGDDRDQAKGS